MKKKHMLTILGIIGIGVICIAYLYAIKESHNTDFDFLDDDFDMDDDFYDDDPIDWDEIFDDTED